MHAFHHRPYKSYQSDKSYVFANVCPCPADFNFSETVDSQDLFDYLAAFFSADPRADLNQDGQVNSADVLDFIVDFFAGCS